MKKTLIFFVTVFLTLQYSAQQDAEADKVLGVWLTGNGKGHIQITKYGDKFGGKVVWLKEPNYADGTPKVDKQNKDVSKRKTPIMGLNNILGFVYKGKGKYEGGNIYDPESGKTYDCIMTLENDNTLKVRGYVGISLIGRTDVWTRVK